MDETAGIYAREIAPLDMPVQLGIASGRVIAVSFPENPPVDADAEHPVLDQIAAYCGGEPVDFESIQVALTVPTDQRAVLETVRTIPHGENLTVQQVTRMTATLDAESETDLDVVRTALATNPVPLLVPDHRVGDGPSGAPATIERQLRSIEGLA